MTFDYLGNDGARETGRLGLPVFDPRQAPYLVVRGPVPRETRPKGSRGPIPVVLVPPQARGRGAGGGRPSGRPSGGRQDGWPYLSGGVGNSRWAFLSEPCPPQIGRRSLRMAYRLGIQVGKGAANPTLPLELAWKPAL